jgi:predicted anti-sigma-YlaC factor YlaD
MTCETVRSSLSEFMDGAVSECALADIRAHVEDCLSCGNLYHTLLAAEGFYSAAKKHDVSEEYRDHLRARLEEMVSDEGRA